MNVLRVIASMNSISGGPCQGIRNSIPYLEKLGVHNEVASLDSPTASFLGSDLFVIHALGTGKSPWAYSPKLIPWLLGNFARFDVVIVHGLWLYPSYAVFKALNRYKKKQNKAPKLYIMPHGMLDPWFQQAQGRELKAIRNWLYWKWIEKHIVNEADGVLFTCEEELRLARETFHPYHPKRELNIGYGILPPPVYHPDMEKAFKSKCPTLGKDLYLLFLGRIHIKKGVDLLIKAYLHLKKKGLLLPKLVIAGPGLDTSYGQQILQLAAGDKNIIFPDMLNGDAKWGALYGCEAFVLPSHQENFGIAVVEALACSKPVIISSQVNTWKEIEKANAGLICKDNEKSVIQILIDYNELSSYEKTNMAKQAKLAFNRYFDIRKIAQQLVDVIR